MEKIQQLIAHLIRYRFWYLAGGSALGVLVTWFMVDQSLQFARKEGTAKIQGEMNDIKTVLNVTVENPLTTEQVSVHPNEKTQEGMAAEIARNVDSLIAAWKLRRDAQTSLLQWPVSIIGSDKFISRFSQYDPPEKFPDLKMDAEMERYCLLYGRQIQQRMPAICETINTRWRFGNRATTTPDEPARSEDAPAGGEEAPATEGQPDGTAPAGQQSPGPEAGQDPAAPPADAPATGGDAPADQDPAPADDGSAPPADDASDPAAADKPADDAPVVKNPETVVWNAANQGLWYSKLTQFKGQDRNLNSFPTVYQVLAVQQDLWLLEAMFEVIAEVNGTGPDKPVVVNDLAAIKRIDHVVFGREARSQLGQLIVPDQRIAGGAAPSGSQLPGMTMGVDVAGMSGDRSADGGQPGAGGGLPPGQSGGAVSDNTIPENLLLLSPFNGRYVDANFVPLPVQAVHDALVAAAPPPDRLELVVAKRVPFRVAVRMKESAIPAFIAACSNSDFEFEIVQVRINRHKAGEFVGFNSSQAGTSPFGGKSPGNSENANEGKPTPETRVNDDVDVEFKGIVRIYNPVDEARIRLVANQQPEPGT